MFAAVAAVHEILAHDRSAWEPIKARLNLSKTTRRSKSIGIALSRRHPETDAVAEEAADARILYRALADLGGKELVGGAADLDVGLFYDPKTKWRSKSTTRLVSFLVLLASWQIVLAHFGNPRLLPGPVVVFATIKAEVASGVLFAALSITIARVAAAFILAMAVGSAIGYAMGATRFSIAWPTLGSSSCWPCPRS